MDSITAVPRHPAPLNVMVSRMNSVEKLLYITQRYNKRSYHGFFGTCIFCGFSRKGNTSQFRVHFTKEAEGGTTCSACTKVPAAITDFYVAQRDLILSKKGSKNTAAATALHSALCIDDSNESLPSSSQNSNYKRSRSEDPSQPSIIQALVSFP